MNKEDSKIFTIQELLEYIENCKYIDCTENSWHYDCNQYESILYYLKQYKNNQERINKAIEYIEQNKSQFINQYGYIESDDELVYAEDLLDILKEVE